MVLIIPLFLALGSGSQFFTLHSVIQVVFVIVSHPPFPFPMVEGFRFVILVPGPSIFLGKARKGRNRRNREVSQAVFYERLWTQWCTEGESLGEMVMCERY